MLTQFIPQANPHASYMACKTEINEAIHRVLTGGYYILGQEVEFFENEFASFMKAKHAIGVANGTDALEIALRACDIGTGDIVFTVSHTAIATVAAIERAGAQPVLVDIDPETYTIDPEKLELTIKAFLVAKKEIPRAIIPVHLYGHPVEMDAILSIANKYELKVIEDCAQAHGAKFKGDYVGTLGDIGTFSFYPTKNLGAIGDGGAAITNNAYFAQKIRSLREYGWINRYESKIKGINSRLDELQAAILRVRLKYLLKDNEERKKIADMYNQTLLNIPEIKQPTEKKRMRMLIIFMLY